MLESPIEYPHTNNKNKLNKLVSLIFPSNDLLKTEQYPHIMSINRRVSLFFKRHLFLICDTRPTPGFDAFLIAQYPNWLR